jgi:hypothetical protein
MKTTEGPPLYLSSENQTRNVGWGGRIRTSEWRNQNPLPYHLATPQYRSGAPRIAVASDHINEHPHKAAKIAVLHLAVTPAEQAEASSLAFVPTWLE